MFKKEICRYLSYFSIKINFFVFFFFLSLLSLVNNLSFITYDCQFSKNNPKIFSDFNSEFSIILILIEKFIVEIKMLYVK